LPFKTYVIASLTCFG